MTPIETARANLAAAVVALTHAQTVEQRARAAYHTALSEDWIARARAEVPTPDGGVEEIDREPWGPRLVRERSIYRLIERRGKGLRVEVIQQRQTPWFTSPPPPEQRFAEIQTYRTTQDLAGNTRACKEMAAMLGVTL